MSRSIFILPKWMEKIFRSKAKACNVYQTGSRHHAMAGKQLCNDTLQMDVNGSLEFDGFSSYTVKVTALQDVQLKDITMHIPFKKEMAKYLMGLGQKGGERPDPVNWKWDVATKNQDGAWIGSVNAGLQYSLRDEKYIRPLNTNFYLQKPLLLPTSWANGDKGGITVGIKGSSMLANNYTGERSLKKGDVLYFNFTLLITPFHTPSIQIFNGKHVSIISITT
jgi:hypothetical protein